MPPGAPRSMFGPQLDQTAQVDLMRAFDQFRFVFSSFMPIKLNLHGCLLHTSLSGLFFLISHCTEGRSFAGRFPVKSHWSEIWLRHRLNPPRSHRAKGWWGESSAPTWANLTNQPLYRERTAPKVEFIIFSIKSIAWLHYYWLCTLTWHPGGKHRCTRLRTRPALTLTFTDTCTSNFSRKILVFYNHVVL